MTPAGGAGLPGMIIVAGHLVVDPAERQGYLEACREAVALARAADGCLDFTIGADLLDDARVNVMERWASEGQLDAFRGSGPTGEQQTQILAGHVSQWEVGEGYELF